MQEYGRERQSRGVVRSLLVISVFCWVALASPPVAADSSSTTLSERLYESALWVFEHADRVAYRHHKVPASRQVEVSTDGSCTSLNDCSGFLGYLLNKVSPRHFEPIRALQPERPYPQAKAYVRFIASLPEGKPAGGWFRLASYRDLRRGDVIAWESQRSIRSAEVDEQGSNRSIKPERTAELTDRGARKTKRAQGNTGHVAIVAGAPQAVAEVSLDDRIIRYVPVPVIDSSSVAHFRPEALPPLAHQKSRNGVGKGMIRLILDDRDRAVGYWEGTFWSEGGKELQSPSYSKRIEFARLAPL